MPRKRLPSSSADPNAGPAPIRPASSSTTSEGEAARGTASHAPIPPGHAHINEHLVRELKALGAETPARTRAKRTIPWIVSASIHALLIALGFLIPWTTRLVLAGLDDQIVTVAADFDNLTPATDVPDANRNLTLPADMAFDTPDPAVNEPTNLRDLLADETRSTSPVRGPAPDDGMRSFSPHGGGRAVSFAGLRGGNVRHVAYIVDASGSMLTYLPIVIDELIRSIDQLDETQQFSVLFYQRNDAIIVPPPGEAGGHGDRARSPRAEIPMLPATRANKLHVYDWIDLDHRNVRAVGQSNPVEAIRIALEQVEPQPEVLFILSVDITGIGEFEVDQQDLLRMIERLNRGPRGELKSIIKTIQFLYQDPLGTLKLIAEANGGTDGYRFLSRAELGLGEDQ